MRLRILGTWRVVPWGAVRGVVVEQIHDEQLPAALALRPDLVTVMAGMNDLIRPRFDIARAVRGKSWGRPWGVWRVCRAVSARTLMS